MNRSAMYVAVSSLVALAVVVAVPLRAQAPATAPAAAAATPAKLSQDQLDSLVAPIALYPDQLLVQVMMASTYPLDVVEAARFIKANKELKGDAMVKAAEQKSWDPSVQSLTAYPQTLEMMNDKLEWTQQLGDAVLADQAVVLKTAQRLRQKATEAGNLKSNEQQKVVVQQDKTIIIEPAQPQTVYVPTYNPAVVYGTWWAPMYPPYYYPPSAYYYPGYVAGAAVVGFGVGLAVGAAWGWAGANWGGGDINIDVNNNFTRNKAEFNNRTKEGGGKFNHNPSQRKGVAYNDKATRDKFAKTDAGAASARRDYRGHEGAGGGDRAGASNNMASNRPGGGDRPGGGAGSGSGNFGGADFGKGSTGGAGGSNFSNRPAGGGASAGTMDRPGGGGGGQSIGASGAASRVGGGGASNYGGGGGGGNQSFNSGMSRPQTSAASNRGASSRASMGGGGGGGRGGGGGGGGRGGGRR